jgi:hypothetical protein
MQDFFNLYEFSVHVGINKYCRHQNLQQLVAWLGGSLGHHDPAMLSTFWDIYLKFCEPFTAH